MQTLATVLNTEREKYMAETSLSTYNTVVCTDVKNCNHNSFWCASQSNHTLAAGSNTERTSRALSNSGEVKTSSSVSVDAEDSSFQLLALELWIEVDWPDITSVPVHVASSPGDACLVPLPGSAIQPVFMFELSSNLGSDNDKLLELSLCNKELSSVSLKVSSEPVSLRDVSPFRRG